MRAGGQHEGVVGEFHPIKLWAPAEEIQPPIPFLGARPPIRLWVPDGAIDPEAETAAATARMDEALGELRRVLHRYRAEMVEPPRAAAA
ncbi:hypothetical protein [Phenylobacterium sp.]|uniref:hypothetical protein n=1 Tax=Phenylobacterium sp. TaxID=1871053 RepID=UPI00301BE15E